MTQFELPNITSGTSEGRLNQLQGYLYQMVEKLNYTMSHMNSNQESIVKEIQASLGSSTKSNEEQAYETFGDIKSLIIKSSDIITAYADRIEESFNSKYVGVAPFGQYQEEMQRLNEQTSKNVSDYYQMVQNLQTEFENFENVQAETNAWIRSGLIDETENGTPIFGIEIGQKSVVDDVEVFNKYSRFTSEGISFYLPGYEKPIATMDGNMLKINSIHISGLVTFGNFSIDTSDGFVIDWIGG